MTGLGERHAAALEKIIQDSPVETRALWEKYAGEIKVAERILVRGGARCDANGAIHVDIAKDASVKYNGCPPYETTMHESGHSIDRAISRKVGYRYSEKYNDGEFEKTLIREADAYIKKHQKELSAASGTRVSISEARASLGKRMIRAGYAATGDVSDMLEGATKGKFSGSGGHGKSYWVGQDTYWGKMGGHSVAVEAFAEMFSATTTNPASLANIKEVFPESYGVFTRMIKEAVG